MAILRTLEPKEKNYISKYMKKCPICNKIPRIRIERHPETFGDYFIVEDHASCSNKKLEDLIDCWNNYILGYELFKNHENRIKKKNTNKE